ncbi:MAG: type II toxin-antitoxin system PemK/MazF family toxin [Acidimicrobiia bacterium]|nr:type II toxin-antitoxin system PemK/MazF family toxin [Acidimicrobiia bacterium]
MLTSGDVVDLDLGAPEGREAGFRHPAVVLTAQRILDAEPAVLQIVPFTSTIRGFATEVNVPADASNGLDNDSVAQCQHVRAVSTARVSSVRGNLGPTLVAQIRETLAIILDIPT